jgi:hypothetical protein
MLPASSMHFLAVGTITCDCQYEGFTQADKIVFSLLNAEF